MMTDQLLDRLAAAGPTLDQAIVLYLNGDLRAAPSTGSGLATKAAVAVVLAGGIAAIPVVTSRQDRVVESPGPGPVVATSQPPDSSVPTGVADEEAWAAINWLWELEPYGNEGDRLHHIVIQDRLRECMQQRGFEYHLVPFTPTVEGRSGRVLLPPLPSEDDVRVRGYDAFRGPRLAADTTPDVPDVPSSTDPDYIEASSLNEELAQDPAWSLALYGDDTREGTCTAEAWDFVDERVETEATERYRAIHSLIPALTWPLDYGNQSLPLADAVEAWRNCMGPAGLEVANPTALAATFSRSPGSDPSSDEVAVALDDLHCRIETGFRDVYRDTIVANIETFRQENAVRLEDLAEATQRDVEALRALAEELGIA